MNETITSISGILVGHDTDSAGRTGCTVILTPAGAVAAVDVRGAAPGTRETDLMRPENLVQEVDAILLTGGSAFGLAAADGVMQWLFEHNIGFDAGITRVPIVPAAVLFDLAVGKRDVWPDHSAGYRACQVATSDPVPEGQVGAGTGATVAKFRGPSYARPGGLGSYAVNVPDGGRVGAIVAVNAVGEIVDPTSGRTASISDESPASGSGAFGQNTTLAVIATDRTLTRTQLLRVAQMAHDALARTIWPSHTLYDGDVVFAISTGVGPAGDPHSLGILATDVLEQSILRAVPPSPPQAAQS